eukprot:7527474-Pyramimonas_sp.AAC.1
MRRRRPQPSLRQVLSWSARPALPWRGGGSAPVQGLGGRGPGQRRGSGIRTPELAHRAELPAQRGHLCLGPPEPQEHGADRGHCLVKEPHVLVVSHAGVGEVIAGLGGQGLPVRQVRVSPRHRPHLEAAGAANLLQLLGAARQLAEHEQRQVVRRGPAPVQREQIFQVHAPPAVWPLHEFAAHHKRGWQAFADKIDVGRPGVVERRRQDGTRDDEADAVPPRERAHLAQHSDLDPHDGVRVERRAEDLRDGHSAAEERRELGQGPVQHLHPEVREDVDDTHAIHPDANQEKGPNRRDQPSA